MPNPQSDEFRLIPTSELVEPTLVLREVNQGNVEYMELRDSLAARGFLNSICVRPSTRIPGKFEIVDGRYRWIAAVEVEIPTIPCIIKFNLSDADVLAMQITANAVRPTTTKSEFAIQIQRVLRQHDGMTMATLSRTLHKSPAWIRWMLRLIELKPAVQRFVDRGEMSLEAAYYLAKLPSQMRDNFIDDARVQSLAEFKALVSGVLAQFRVAVKRGKMELTYGEFAPQPWLRAMRDIRVEHEKPQVGPNMLTNYNCKTAMEGWKLALAWILHLDRDSIERAKVRHRRKVKPVVVCKQENSHDVKFATDGTKVS